MVSDMAEYIEREALMLHIAGVKVHLQGDSEWISGYRDALQAVGETVQNFPAADVVERKRGEWQWNEHGQMFCSACGEYPELAIEKPFCSNCGADMRSQQNILCDQGERRNDDAVH